MSMSNLFLFLAQQQPLFPPGAPGAGGADDSSVGDAIGQQWDAFMTWLRANWSLVALVALVVALLVLLLLWLGQRLPTRGLRRDGLEVFRRDMQKAAREAGIRGRTLWLTGSEQYPPVRLGRLTGFCRDVEAQWYEYRRGLLGRPHLLVCNPDDVVTSHETREVHVRAVSVRHHRGVFAAVPDVHDPRERAAWSRTVGREIHEADDLAEAWKEYVSSAIDNVVGLDESLLAAQDRHYLRQRVTYTDDEQPHETMVAQPPPPTVGTQQGGDHHG